METFATLLADPANWASLATLTILEVVLGVDNLIFISILSAKLPEHQQALGRRLGLGAALVTRILLLFCVSWLATLDQTVLAAMGEQFTWREIILLIGGLFLIGKATSEIHGAVEGEAGHGPAKAATATLTAVVLQIAVIDIVFSLDTVMTAIGMADHFEIMATAIVIAIGVMMFAAEPVSAFVQAHPTVKMLALSFLILIGVSLVAEGLEFHIPKGYLYFAIAFSIGVEFLNQLARRNRRKASG